MVQILLGLLGRLLHLVDSVDVLVTECPEVGGLIRAEAIELVVIAAHPLVSIGLVEVLHGIAVDVGEVTHHCDQGPFV